MTAAKVRFETVSGTSYTLDLETHELVRVGAQPLISVNDGSDMPEPSGEIVHYSEPPTVGEPFVYFHPTLYGCVSTPVISIEDI